MSLMLLYHYFEQNKIYSDFLILELELSDPLRQFSHIKYLFVLFVDVGEHLFVTHYFEPDYVTHVDLSVHKINYQNI
jgi:hypothetical protein